MNPQTASETRTVLVVEDDPAVRRFLVYALQHLGYRVSECSNVSDAERFLQATTPDIVLADCNLPKESGTMLVRRTHELHSIIGMSGERQRGAEMLEAGALDFMPKPIGLGDLKDVIEKHREAVKAKKALAQSRIEEEETTPSLQRNCTRAHLTDAPKVWMREWSREQRRRRLQP